MEQSTICPKSGALLHAHVKAAGSKDAPGPGALTVCAHCSTSLVFEEDMKLRELQPQELEELRTKSPQAMKVIELIKKWLDAKK